MSKKASYIVAALLLFLNLYLIYFNNQLKKKVYNYKESYSLDLDYKIISENLINSKIYRYEIENNVLDNLYEFLDSQVLDVDNYTIFLFDQFDCKICLDRVFNDLRNIEQDKTVIIGLFNNKTSYNNFIKNNNHIHNIIFCKKEYFFRNTNEYFKPFLAVKKGDIISNIYVIEKVFDKSYDYYINEILSF